MRRTPKSREEALKIQSRREHKAVAGTEATVQYECVKWYKSVFGDDGRLFAVVNENVKNPLAKGIRRGVSDLCFVLDGVLFGIEMKHPNERHGSEHIKEQAEWLVSVPKSGGFFTSLEAFQKFVLGGEIQFSASEVLAYLEKTKQKTIIFNEELLWKLKE